MTNKSDELEEQRRKNAVEMTKRCIRISEYLQTSYPMKPDNPCLNMADEEFKAYIRKQREEFEARHKKPAP